MNMTIGSAELKGAGNTVATKDRGIFALRAFVGLAFAFAGFDKFFMWANGKPFTSAGYLTHATGGQWLGSTGVNPTQDFWVSLGNNASAVHLIDTLVVFGECAIGIALVLGLATRFSAVMGTLLMGLLLVSNWSFANGPFNEQATYLAITAVIAYVGAGAYALDSVIASRVTLIQRVPVVKYALG
jgi:thiosulfate dehydrogenase (quinone) large subunit